MEEENVSKGVKRSFLNCSDVPELMPGAQSRATPAAREQFEARCVSLWRDEQAETVWHKKQVENQNQREILHTVEELQEMFKNQLDSALVAAIFCDSVSPQSCLDTLLQLASANDDKIVIVDHLPGKNESRKEEDVIGQETMVSSDQLNEMGLSPSEFVAIFGSDVKRSFDDFIIPPELNLDDGVPNPLLKKTSVSFPALSSTDDRKEDEEEKNSMSGGHSSSPSSSWVTVAKLGAGDASIFATNGRSQFVSAKSPWKTGISSSFLSTAKKLHTDCPVDDDEKSSVFHHVSSSSSSSPRLSPRSEVLNDYDLRQKIGHAREKRIFLDKKRRNQHINKQQRRKQSTSSGCEEKGPPRYRSLSEEKCGSSEEDEGT